MIKDRVNLSVELFNAYVESFSKLTEEQIRNFSIKQNHSVRVAENSALIAEKLELPENEKQVAQIAAIFHDIGRFEQLVKYNSFNDLVSVDHAELAVEILKKQQFLEQLDCEEKDVICTAILAHNKLDLPKKLTEQELLHARLLRDADKLDILKVLSDYYSTRNSKPNHTLTWDLPKGTQVSESVAKEVLAGKMVSKKNVASELDAKILQLSWIFDLNFKVSVRYLLEKRYLEKIYESMSKSDRIIDIYRKVKVFAENKIMD